MNKRGQSLVLFVLMLPIFMIFMAGIIELGNLLINQKELDNVTKICFKNYQEDSIPISNCLEINKLKSYQLKDNELTVTKELKGLVVPVENTLTSTYIYKDNGYTKE